MKKPCFALLAAAGSLLLPGLPCAAAESSPKHSMAGSAVLSDEWDVRRDKGEEEFKGNVRFNQGPQHARADWAIYIKPLDLWQARGHLYMWDRKDDDSLWEAWGETSRYDRAAQQGWLKHAGSVVRFRRTFANSKGPQLWLGNAGWARWDGSDDKLYLEDGTALLGSGIFIRAQHGVYDRNARQADFTGGRPVAVLNDARVSAALQGDRLTIFEDNKHVTAVGGVRGWFHLKHDPKYDGKKEKKGKKKDRK